MKRSIIALAAVTAVCFAGAAHAAAPAGSPASKTATRCVTTGSHDEATVTFKDRYARTTIVRTGSFGDFVSGPVKVCQDGTVTKLRTTGYATITINGVLVCNNKKAAPLFDPFVFGGGIHNASGDPCGGNVAWSALVPGAPTYAPSPYPAGRTPNSFWTGYPQAGGVSGSYWYGCPAHCYKLTVPAKTFGWFSNHGVQVVY
jgi:hypothetical protein